MDEFSNRLRIAIEHSGKQQKSLAFDINVSPARLSNYVNGHSEPSFDVLVMLCRALDVSADYLLGLSDTLQPAAKKPVEVKKKEPEVNAITSSSILGGLPARDLLSDMDSDLICQAKSYIAYLREQQNQRNAAKEKKKTKAKA